MSNNSNEKIKIYNQLRIKRLIEAGLCIACAKPHNETTQKCKVCAEKTYARRKETRKHRLEANLCTTCGRTHNEKGRKCATCKEKGRTNCRKLNDGRIEANLCIKCGASHIGENQTCSVCKEKAEGQYKSRREERRAKDLCQRCSKLKEGPGPLCNKHVFISSAYRSLKNSNQWNELETMFHNQNKKCPYTGETLILGGNATIDHIVPRARGGANEIHNLQWVTLTANRAKSDLAHEDFISLCRLIARRHEPAKITPIPFRRSASISW